MTKLFAWDYHGTLAKNNELAVHRSLNAAFHELGIPKRANLMEVVELYGKTWGEYVQHYLPDETPEMIDKVIASVRMYGGRFAPMYVKPMDHAHDVLSAIKERGDKNMLITNTTPKGMEMFIRLIGIDKYIDHAAGISLDDETNGINTAEHKAQRLRKYAGSRFEKIIMIGDRESDVEAGKIAGAVPYLFMPRCEDCIREDGVHVINDLRKVLDVYRVVENE
ncbi:MAG: HAD hydrolase-like protein [Candidatus Aenigmarchaeota archaeon]|nr:HAD hydrolase-like protein [Candidatus Aenigmarchaeota archaeon]